MLLFDEFDVFGERSQVGDHGEMRRVAAAVLQLLEDRPGESLVVATSNHPKQIDTAMWRRFDELVEFELLSLQMLTRLISFRLRAMWTDIAPNEWARQFRHTAR